MKKIYKKLFLDVPLNNSSEPFDETPMKIKVVGLFLVNTQAKELGKIDCSYL